MRARFSKTAKDEILACEKFIDNKEKLQNVIKNNKDKKIYVEIGMGKGDFISNMANIDKENIYIGIELCIPVLAIAIKKINRFEEENGKMKNLYLMSFDAKTINEYFEEGQIEKIYLNFSDPWPKKRHTKRRLTFKDFLSEYEKVLIKNGIIEFKTDNRELFEFSLVSMQNYGMKFLEVYLDLHKTDVFNIETEYEKKFSKYGPIYKLIASF